MRVAELTQAIPTARFLFMVRNPYAVVEGIVRRRAHQLPMSAESIATVAARHVANCMMIQRENIERHGDVGVAFTYEEMCAEPLTVGRQVTSLVPALDDIDFDRSTPVKGLYDEAVRNMNAEQIDRLTAAQLDDINDVLVHHADLIASFGYELLDQPSLSKRQ